MNAIRKNTLLYQKSQRIGCLLKLDRRSFRLLLENLVYLWFQQMGNWWCVLTDSKMRFWTIKKRCWSFLVFKFLAHIISISILILQQCPSLVDRRTWSYGNRFFSPNSFRDRSGVWGVIAFIHSDGRIHFWRRSFHWRTCNSAKENNAIFHASIAWDIL